MGLLSISSVETSMQSPLSPLREVEVCKEGGGGKMHGVLEHWKQVLLPFDTSHWDQTRFLPHGTKQVLKLKPPGHLGLVHRHKQVSRMLMYSRYHLSHCLGLYDLHIICKLNSQDYAWGSFLSLMGDSGCWHGIHHMSEALIFLSFIQYPIHH